MFMICYLEINLAQVNFLDHSWAEMMVGIYGKYRQQF